MALQPRTIKPLFIQVERQKLKVLWGLKVFLCKHFLLFSLGFQGFQGIGSGLSVCHSDLDHQNKVKIKVTMTTGI